MRPWPIIVSVALAFLCQSEGRIAGAESPRRKPADYPSVALPSPAEVQSLSAYPTNLALVGSDAAAQFVISAHLKDGRIQDVTAAVQYEAADPRIVRIASGGRVGPLANGHTDIVARYGPQTVRISVRTSEIGIDRPINFTNQVVPIFTKLGCNAGACHGKASGQNGFKLSLLGYEPEADFNALVKEARGRRIFPTAPEHSLLLRKPTGAMAHGGGKLLPVDSDEYRLIRRWIAAGAPFGKPDDPTVTAITVFPEQRILTRQNRQQLAVLARYSDGTIEDITRRAQYESNDTDIAVVDGTGLVQSQAVSGEAAIMARYQGFVTTFRATVPLGMPIPAYRFSAQTAIDQATHKKWQQLGLVPSEPCSDDQFIRRACIDITGTLPTPARVLAFVRSTDPDKRGKLVDTLVESPEYSYYFANKWSDILRVKRRGQPPRAFGTFAFHDWIGQAIARDMPYDEFVREIIVANGDENTHPPTVWYKELQSPEQLVDDIAQVFLGQRLACAQCHHHPYEKWSQDDYWGLAAFFGRLGRKAVPVPGGFQNQPAQVLVVFSKPGGTVQNKRTGQPANFKILDGASVEIPAGEDPRQKLADWMLDPANPFLARAVANRYWAHFFGRGIVDALDDLRVTNPPSNPELLDALAKDFVEHRYSLKHLVQTICKSRTYQLSSVPNDFNKQDKQAYARYYPKRMSAEVLLDAVCQVTNSPGSFNGLPQDRNAPRRAIMLPDESYSSYFLEVFGRPQRSSACECERTGEATLAQALHLLNSDEIQAMLGRGDGRADLLAKDKRPDPEKIEELFLWAFAHKPTPVQLQAALAHLTKNARNSKTGYENVLWALINSKEFVFNQ